MEDDEKVNSYTVKLGNTNQPRMRGIQRRPPQKKMTKENLGSRGGRGLESGRKSVGKVWEARKSRTSYAVCLKHRLDERGPQDLGGHERAPGLAPEGSPTGRWQGRDRRGEMERPECPGDAVAS